MELKKYKVVLKQGICSDIFDTPIQAVKRFGSNLDKVVEFTPPHKKKLEQPTQNALLISARSDEDLEISLECGYAVMYNCPNKTKLYEGMPYLEVSENNVLEGRVVRLDKFEKSIHTRWGNIVPRFPDRLWRYAIYHRGSKIISRKEAERKYDNPLNGTQGGISYIKY
jgi:hypothetical protein